MQTPSTFAQRLAGSIAARRRWVVLAMLLALHAALAFPASDDTQRAWLLVHFGLFLLWQPFIAGEREIELLSGVLLFVITVVTLYFLAGWMIVAWLLIVLGILGGRVFTVRAAPSNRFYLVAFAYVLGILLLRAVPTLVLPGHSVPEPIALFSLVALPLLLLSLVVLPFGSDAGPGQVFDFFYAVLVFQLGLVLVLGSLALMRYTGDHYFLSVALTMVGFGGALFVLAVLWNPLAGFSGLRTYFSRYLLSVGMPFELWMRRIAELSETEVDSRRFLEQSLREIVALAWMKGARWRSPDGEGFVGELSAYATSFSYEGLEVEFHTEIRLSPALFLHMRLLAQVVGEFYAGKRREAALRHNAYLQAVHETGARLTHDVKNLLQSLYALTSLAAKAPPEGATALLQRQLPQLTRRLHTTLEQLRAPGVEKRELATAAQAWWADAGRRLADSGVKTAHDIECDVPVPGSLFESFLENALDNARAKAARERGVEISVTFQCRPRHIELSVCDTGGALDAGVAQRLFREPIERGEGLGIGLYNVARLAQAVAYRLELASNEPGRVCFRLLGE